MDLPLDMNQPLPMQNRGEHDCAAQDRARTFTRSHAWTGDFDAEEYGRVDKPRRKSLMDSFTTTPSSLASFQVRRASMDAAEGGGPPRERRRSLIDNIGDSIAMFASMNMAAQAPEPCDDSRDALRAEFDRHDKAGAGRLSERQMGSLLFARLYALRRREAGRLRSVNGVGAAMADNRAFDQSTKMYLADAQAASLVIAEEFGRLHVRSMDFEAFVEWNKRQARRRHRGAASRDGAARAPPAAAPARPPPEASSSWLSRGLTMFRRESLGKEVSSTSLIEGGAARPPAVESRSHSFPVKTQPKKKSGFLAMLRQYKDP